MLLQLSEPLLLLLSESLLLLLLSESLLLLLSESLLLSLLLLVGYGPLLPGRLGRRKAVIFSQAEHPRTNSTRPHQQATNSTFTRQHTIL